MAAHICTYTFANTPWHFRSSPFHLLNVSLNQLPANMQVRRGGRGFNVVRQRGCNFLLLASWLDYGATRPPRPGTAERGAAWGGRLDEQISENERWGKPQEKYSGPSDRIPSTTGEFWSSKGCTSLLSRARFHPIRATHLPCFHCLIVSSFYLCVKLWGASVLLVSVKTRPRHQTPHSFG